MTHEIRGAANRLVDARTGEATTWADLPDADLPAPAAVVVGSSFGALPAVRAHATTGTELLVVARSRMEPALRADLLGAGFNVVEDARTETSTAPREPDPDRLWLLTSGSTGRPKRIGHTLGSLTTVDRATSRRNAGCAPTRPAPTPGGR